MFRKIHFVQNTLHDFIKVEIKLLPIFYASTHIMKHGQKPHFTCILLLQIPVVEQFLLDLEKHDKFSGFCNLGIFWQPIESDHMRKYFKLFNKETGVLISKVLKLSSSCNRLQRGDVLMALDNVQIADDGTVGNFATSMVFSIFPYCPLQKLNTNNPKQKQSQNSFLWGTSQLVFSVLKPHRNFRSYITLQI